MSVKTDWHAVAAVRRRRWALLPSVLAFAASITLPALALAADPDGDDKPDPISPRNEVKPNVEPEPQAGTFSFVLENDVFYDTDRNYTSGVRLSWLTAADKTPDWALETVRFLPFLTEGGTVRTTYSIGQSLYTPDDIKLADPPSTDRPYAGWLYGSAGLIVENGKQLDQLELAIGIVGPAALGEPTQKLVHEIVGAPEPRGWDTQLSNEPGILLTYQRSWRALATGKIGGFQLDVTPHAGAALGNVFTYANGGLTVRFGNDLPLDFGPPRVQPSLPGSGFFEPPPDGFGWYAFAGIEGRAVARNIFLDGNTFSNSRSVEKEPFVGDLQVGVALAWENVRLAYTHILRTREFKDQNEIDNFGGISVSVRF